MAATITTETTKFIIKAIEIIIIIITIDPQGCLQFITLKVRL
ncbi:cobyrinic acid ac-diamide synthase [Corchorus capsularis]|uniref:Cobyrinic acid ac-diamide synthase n=1 Tax=Corchorus capsularis TaxID=210143 RepID=A0A1R3HA22_COCAP|nr:cobyrinic acid ac-diamide synthase [Corchorus capsularis]